MTVSSTEVTGRFAPTPSGPLHFGSLVTAVASYCQAKSQNGRWLLRIEDLDTPRVVKDSADNILRTLEGFGFNWDGQVVYQSQRFEAYEEALQQLQSDGLLYRCQCSRKSLMSQDLQYGPLGMIYPGHCRGLHLNNKNLSLRLDTEPAKTQRFNDIHYGPYTLNISTDVGDIVLKRIDGVYAYHLAVVLDDAWQGVNQIVRGADLLEVTCLHLYINRLLKLEAAQYLHIPLIKNSEGKKLSKQTGAPPISIERAREQLVQSLKLLGQPITDDLISARPEQILEYACRHWQAAAIPKIR